MHPCIDTALDIGDTGLFSCDLSASSPEVGEALIILHTRLMNACPLVEAGSRENWGKPQMPDLVLFETLFNLYV